MTKEREALKLSLEALEDRSSLMKWQEARDAVKEALAQPEQEPVVGTKTWFEDGKVVTQNLTAKDIYKEPEQREPVAYSGNGTAGRENMTAPTGFFFQMPKAEKQESAMVKHMMEWVAFLKAKSDNGQHKQIPSNLSAGAFWDLAVELEQFIYTHPQPKREWVGLTDELEALFTNIDHAISSGAWNVQKGSQTWEIIEHAKAAHGIKENT
jgi:hypothetical protein